MDFRKLIPEDQAIINNYLKDIDNFQTDFSIATILLFQEFKNPEIHIGEKSIYIKGYMAGEEVFFPPLCKIEDFYESIEKIKSYYKEKDKPYIILYIQNDYIREYFKKKNMLPNENFFKNEGYFKNENVIVYNDRNSSEYVYLPKDLLKLEGNKYRKIREKINSFYKEYHNQYEIVEYTDNEYKDLLNLIKIWNDEKNFNYITESIMLKYILENKDKLDIKIYLLKIKGKTIGITIIQELPNKVGVVIFEKSYYKYKNANCILNLFEVNKLQNCRGISRQEDMGIKGLRQAKLSYKPFYMENKYNLYQYNQKEFFELYQNIFGDSTPLIQLVQNSKTYNIKHSSFILKIQKIVSIGSTREKQLRIFNQTENIPFIFGIATAPEERKKGYAGEVLQKILNKIYLDKYTLAMIATQDEYLFKYYEKFGFVKFNYNKKVPIENLFKKDFCIQEGELKDAEEILRLFNEYTQHYKLAQHRNIDFTTERLKEVFIDKGKLFILSQDHHNYGYFIYEQGEITEYINLKENESNESMSVIKSVLMNSGLEYLLDCEIIKMAATESECDINKDTYALLRIINPPNFIKKYIDFIYYDENENFNKNIIVKDSICGESCFNIKRNNNQNIFSMIIDKTASTVVISISELLQEVLNKFKNNNENYKIKDKFFYTENW